MPAELNLFMNDSSFFLMWIEIDDRNRMTWKDWGKKFQVLLGSSSPFIVTKIPFVRKKDGFVQTFSCSIGDKMNRSHFVRSTFGHFTDVTLFGQ